MFREPGSENMKKLMVGYFAACAVIILVGFLIR